jgi:hypothetical protein
VPSIFLDEVGEQIVDASGGCLEFIAAPRRIWLLRALFERWLIQNAF